MDANPHVRDVYAPFIYKPAKRAHRVLIERALGRVYERVIILDSGDAKWWTHGQHLIVRYAEACAVPASSWPVPQPTSRWGRSRIPRFC